MTMTLDEAKSEYLMCRLLYNSACEKGDRNRRWEAYDRMKRAEINLIDVATDKACAANGDEPMQGEAYEALLTSPTARRKVAELSLTLED